MQSIVIYIEPNRDAFITSEKIANFYMNRFFIDEDAGFELLGIIELENQLMTLLVRGKVGMTVGMTDRTVGMTMLG